MDNNFWREIIFCFVFGLVTLMALLGAYDMLPWDKDK